MPKRELPDPPIPPPLYGPPADLLPKRRGRPPKEADRPPPPDPPKAAPGHAAVPVLVRLAIQLTRQPSAQTMSVEEIAADAAELLRLGDLARLAIEFQLPPEIHFRRADASRGDTVRPSPTFARSARA